MADLALYRKYRSERFDDVVGQDPVVSTLTQALASERTSHAYLLSGPRGVGKTTVARLLARGLNCTGSTKPCGKCANCQAALSGNLDLIEIDGASNRGIDEIRELRDKIGLSPALGRYKVYIIDEVHMLTEAAFNALLKTLEEPPPHAVFILATTEVHKLPATIISRTQHFRFQAIGPDQLLAHLRHIAAAEQIRVSDDALELIAGASRGSFRDSISMLDQVASGGAETVDAPLVRQTLGLGDAGALDNLAQALLDRAGTKVFACLDVVLASGLVPEQAASQLLARLRVRLPLAMSSDPGEAERLIQIIDSLLPVAKSSWPELALEAALARLSLPEAAKTSPVEVSAPTLATKAIQTETETLAETPAVTNPVPVSGADDQALWLKTLALIKDHNNSLYALLRACEMQSAEDQVVVYCRFNFHRDRLQEAKNRQIIERCLARVYGRKLRVVAELKPGVAEPPLVAESGELVSSALEILGGEVVYD